MVCQWVAVHFGIIDALFLAAAAAVAATAAAAAAAAFSCHCTLSQGARSNISNNFNGYLSCSVFQDTLFPKLSCSDGDTKYLIGIRAQVVFRRVSTGKGNFATSPERGSWRFHAA